MIGRTGGVRVACGILLAAGWAHAAAVVVPNIWAGTEGPSAANFFASGVGQKQLQINASSEFGAVPLLLTSFALRPDVNLCAGNPCGAFSTTIHNLQITLATTTRAPDDADTVFADYLTTNAQVVFSGDLALSSSYTGPVAGPKNFDILFPFTSSYLYNPAAGNLVVQVAINSTDGIPVNLDAAQAAGDPVSRLFGGFSATVGLADSFGFIVQFQGQAPSSAPEPGACFLVAVGMAAMLYRRRR
ncbi:MAG TPA: hypothetical protein VKE70_11475 [Candidatus Solibacter sp.]|nr:hypothetical protein [Candidatus Solibacter sp.]